MALLHSYKIRKSQFLSQDMKDKRKDRAAKLFNKLKHPLQTKMLFFSDEKNFYQVQIVNSQNCNWLALSPQDLLILMKTKHLIHIMMFEVVTDDGDAMPPFIFTHSLRLNTEAKRVSSWCNG